MGTMLSGARRCEHDGCFGYESNHIKGNNTGTELETSSYFNLPWTYVFRCNDSRIAENIALRQEHAVANKHIGYSQPGRATYWAELQKVAYDPARIANDCDADCSSLTNGNVKCAFMTYNVATSITGFETTSEMPAKYAADSHFANVTASINLSTGDGLRRGDVLVTPGKHTEVCTTGSSSLNTTPKWVGRVDGCRTTAVYKDTAKNLLTEWAVLSAGNLVDVCDESAGYYYVRIAAKYYGFVDKAYIVNNDAVTTKMGTVTTTLCLRKSPKTGAVVAYLPKGAKITITGQTTASDGRVWYAATYNGKSGYCSSYYVKT